MRSETVGGGPATSGEPRTEEAALEALRDEVQRHPLPRHVAIIMDGNGRWAEARGWRRLEGHRRGSEAVRRVTRAARRLGLTHLTLYAFSAQNWTRPPDEVDGLMTLLGEYLRKERAELVGNGIRLQAIGEIERLPRPVQEALASLAADTAHLTGMTLTLALSYGAREELVRAAQAIARAAANGALRLEEIDASTLDARLWTHGMPDPDLVVRTGGERRLSNFLLYQAAYAELVWSDAAWPDYGERELLEAIREYQRRERRFGRTGAQIRAEMQR